MKNEEFNRRDEKIQADIESYLQNDDRIVDFEMEEEESDIKGYNYISKVILDNFNLR